jgi:hypothetical protein
MFVFAQGKEHFLSLVLGQFLGTDQVDPRTTPAPLGADGASSTGPRSILVAVPDQPFATLGRKTDEVVISICYRIIELFSGGLCSSPNKAIEELVTNAYDALASEVRLLVPANTAAEDATIRVLDNGESMDVAGLHELWQIASSKKPSTRMRAHAGRSAVSASASSRRTSSRSS